MHTFSRSPLTRLGLGAKREREEKKLRLCAPQSERMQKMLYSIMGKHWCTVWEGACAMWKNESALAAHRQIGRMLHNHQQDESRMGATRAPEKPRAFFSHFQCKKRFFSQNIKMKNVLWKHEAFQKICAEWRHTASHRADLAVFRFFPRSLLNIDSLLPLVWLCIFQFFSSSMINFFECIGARELSYSIKVHIKLWYSKSSACICLRGSSKAWILFLLLCSKEKYFSERLCNHVQFCFYAAFSMT